MPYIVYNNDSGLITHTFADTAALGGGAGAAGRARAALGASTHTARRVRGGNWHRECEPGWYFYSTRVVRESADHIVDIRRGRLFHLIRNWLENPMIAYWDVKAHPDVETYTSHAYMIGKAATVNGNLTSNAKYDVILKEASWNPEHWFWAFHRNDWKTPFANNANQNKFWRMKVDLPDILPLTGVGKNTKRESFEPVEVTSPSIGMTTGDGWRIVNNYIYTHPYRRGD